MLLKNIIKLVIILLVFLTNSNLLNAGNIGKYAVLIFGGKTVTELIPPQDSAYVKYEMAKMFDALLNYYDYDNDDIYVHNLSGDKNRTEDYYHYFQDYAEVTNYRPATENEYLNRKGVRQTFHDIHNNIWSHWNDYNENIILIFISGHKGSNSPAQDPNGNYTKHHYYFFQPTGQTLDQTFAQWIDNDLLTYNNQNIKSKTRLVFVTGFCSSFGFWDDSPSYPELKDVSDYISLTVADSLKGYTSNIDAGPATSFMRFWADEVKNPAGKSIYQTFLDARNELIESKDGWEPGDPDTWGDIPYSISTDPQDTDWNSYYSLNGLIAPNRASITNSSTEQGEITIHFISARAETCFVYYDTDSGHPYNGSDANEGSLTLTGLTNGEMS